MNDNLNVNANNSNKRIFYIIFASLLVLILMFFVFSQRKQCSPQEKELGDFDTSYSKKTIEVDKAEFGYTDAISDKMYTKVHVSMTNKLEEDTNTNIFLFQLIDSDGNIMSWCRNLGTIGDDKTRSDMLPASLPANGKISGYVYCEDSEKKGAGVRITYTTGAYLENTGYWQLNLKYYDLLFSDDVEVIGK